MSGTRKATPQQVREMSAAARCDPRTIRRVLAGLPVKGDAGERATAAVKAAGLLPKRAKR